MDQADQFWAAELGVAPRVLRVDGFYVHERANADASLRATIVGTPTATVVSLPAGQAHMFLLPQYRARDVNAASVALARRVGFVEYGWMATVRVRLPDK